MPNYQKGFISPVILFVSLAIVGAFITGYVSAKYPSFSSFSQENKIAEEVKKQVESKLNELKPATPQATSEAILLEDNTDLEQESIEKITQTKDLPDIAAAVIKDELIEDNTNIPRIDFRSNDGEYAVVSVGHLGTMGGHVAFLVKRSGVWNVVYKGNGFGECSEIEPIRLKFSIDKDFLPCGDEIAIQEP